MIKTILDLQKKLKCLNTPKKLIDGYEVSLSSTGEHLFISGPSHYGTGRYANLTLDAAKELRDYLNNLFDETGASVADALTKSQQEIEEYKETLTKVRGSCKVGDRGLIDNIIAKFKRG